MSRTMPMSKDEPGSVIDARMVIATTQARAVHASRSIPFLRQTTATDADEAANRRCAPPKITRRTRSIGIDDRFRRLSSKITTGHTKTLLESGGYRKAMCATLDSLVVSFLKTKGGALEQHVLRAPSSLPRRRTW